MGQRVGVRFQQMGIIYFFDAVGIPCQVGDTVVVETVQGISLGSVAMPPQEATDAGEALQPMLRLALPEDRERWEENQRKAQTALALAKERAVQAGLSMKFLQAESNLEGTRMTIYFAAEKRVDFRRLLRDLSLELGLKVELRQMGARDESRLLGGLGPCGRVLCCATHLCNLGSVSMKMAREQGLPLNPDKLSGICGRLLCCLAYEVENYRRVRDKGSADASQGEASTPPEAPSET